MKFHGCTAVDLTWNNRRREDRVLRTVRERGRVQVQQTAHRQSGGRRRLEQHQRPRRPRFVNRFLQLVKD